MQTDIERVCVFREIESVYVERETERDRDGRPGTVRVWPKIRVRP